MVRPFRSPRDATPFVAAVERFRGGRVANVAVAPQPLVPRAIIVGRTQDQKRAIGPTHRRRMRIARNDEIWVEPP